MASASTHDWIHTLALRDRLGTQDLVLQGESTPETPHAGAIEACFERLGLSGVLIIGSVPTIGFLDQPDLDQAQISRIHRALWNQGLMSILIVSLPSEFRVYTLWEPPFSADVHPDTLDRLVIEVLKAGTDALRLQTLIAEIECGRYFEEHRPFFRENARIDSTLLSNLEETVRRLRKRGLDAEAARAVLLQVIFISYLEDRRIVDDVYYRNHVRAKGVASLADIFKLRSLNALDALFRRLRRDFNGDIFYGPCSFGPEKGPRLSRDHLEVLDEFRSGLIELATGQMRFWPFDFSYVPVELISSIYDRFLNEQDSDRRSFGSYFTPTFLADITVEQAWGVLQQKRRNTGVLRVLDPACGSGIFLVRVFQRMIRAWRVQHSDASPPWRTLKYFLSGLYGIDKQADAVRISVFSLYIALLEEVEPPAIVELLRKGRILPRLFDKTLLTGDFFNPNLRLGQFDLVIGNPPWISRNSAAAESALAWCEQRDLPMPQKEIAWAFIWKTQVHARRAGTVGLLLPAMGILHNHTEAAQQARSRWLRMSKFVRVVNFSDVRFQLFEDADRPTILAILGSGTTEAYQFQYWCPKATRILSAAKILVISAADQWTVDSHTAACERFFWKRRLWASGRELRLLDWLLELPPLRRLVSSFRTQRDTGVDTERNSWTIGQGFQELHTERAKGALHGSTIEPLLTGIPFLDTAYFQAWVIPTVASKPWQSSRVRRAGFVPGYFGPRILVIKGVQPKTGLIRASYVEQDFPFRHSIQAIKFPASEKPRAKLLTAILNSDLAAWFLFHISASLGIERSEVHIEELLELPFPDPPDLSREASGIAQAIVAAVDALLASKDRLFAPDTTQEIQQINRMVCRYFGLSADETTIVEEGVRKVIPSVQPRRRVETALLREVSSTEDTEYAKTLIATLEQWLEPGTRLQAVLLGEKAPVRAVQLRFAKEENGEPIIVNRSSDALMEAIHEFRSCLPLRRTRNIYFNANLKVFAHDALLLVKPSDARFWLRTSALNDADEIAGDLLIERHREQLSQSDR